MRACVSFILITESSDKELKMFFSDEFWQPKEETQWYGDYTQWNVFWVTPVVLLVVSICRIVVERCIAQRIGRYMGVSERKCSPPVDNQMLQHSYKLNRQPKRDEILRLAKALGWKPIDISKWFWKARSCTKPSKLTRFTESFWRLTNHILSLAFGAVVLYQEPVLVFADYFTGYPYQSHDAVTVVYWCTQISFCSVMFLSQVFSAIKKDATYSSVALVRYLVTMVLLTISNVAGVLKAGLVINCIHSVSDVAAEIAYLLDYTKHAVLSQAMFTSYAVTFFITRILLYPFWVLWSIWFYLPENLTLSPVLYSTFTALLALQVVHVYWFSHIAIMVWKSFIKRKDAKEKTAVSSDSESEKKQQ